MGLGYEPEASRIQPSLQSLKYRLSHLSADVDCNPQSAPRKVLGSVMSRLAAAQIIAIMFDASGSLTLRASNQRTSVITPVIIPVVYLGVVLTIIEPELFALFSCGGL